MKAVMVIILIYSKTGVSTVEIPMKWDTCMMNMERMEKALRSKFEGTGHLSIDPVVQCVPTGE